MKCDCELWRLLPKFETCLKRLSDIFLKQQWYIISIFIWQQTTAPVTFKYIIATILSRNSIAKITLEFLFWNGRASQDRRMLDIDFRPISNRILKGERPSPRMGRWPSIRLPWATLGSTLAWWPVRLGISRVPRPSSTYNASILAAERSFPCDETGQTSTRNL